MSEIRNRDFLEVNESLFKADSTFPRYGIVGMTSPELQIFVWRSYRKLSRAVRRLQKKLERQLEMIREV